MGEPCYAILRKPKGFESKNEATLRKRLEGDDFQKCRLSLEEILQNLLDGEKFPSNLMMPIINRYQMNRFTGGGGHDKRIKKLLYILWECLPKKTPEGNFLDKLVMVCGAFDRDLKHPNQYVCGSVLKTLSRTKEPEVIRELVHSVEKCLEWSHTYQRKNAVLAMAMIHKTFPDLNPSTPKIISDYLWNEKDDECKRAALQALLQIAPEQAKTFLFSFKIPDIHCMDASIQLLFVELIKKIFDSNDSQTYVKILSSLIKSSSSPSVRYQAATTLTKFSRDPESIKLSASCLIDICAKDCDNNVKLIALDSVIAMRRINGADRVLRKSIMDIVYILQSASDLELHEKILRLTMDLMSPLTVGGVVTALKQEMKKVLCSQQETVQYRRLLVDTVRRVAEKYPSAIMEFELLDTLLTLFIGHSIDERTTARLTLLFKIFLSNNSEFRAQVTKKMRECFNLIKDNIPAHRGLIHLLGEFSEKKDEIEATYDVLKSSLGDLPIVKPEDSTNEAPTISEHPPLRSYYLKNKFDTIPAVCYSLVKMASRYQQVVDNRPEKDRMIARFMFIMASILNLGHSNQLDHEGNTIRLNNDHTENLLMSVNILQNLSNDHTGEVSKLIAKIVTEDMRSQLRLLVKNLEQDRNLLDVTNKTLEQTRFDDKINISLFGSRNEDLGFVDDDDNEADSYSHLSMPDIFGEVPLTGTIDPIYAYCEFDVNQYDIRLKINLENRTPQLFENVILELAARGDGTSNLIDRPEAIVLAPRSTACIVTNVKVVSAENRRLFGSIAFDSSEQKEQVIMLNDISVNITDYIKPSSISFDEFRDIWRDCEWENKVTVKTKLTSLRNYLTHLVVSTNMHCVTTERGLSGDCNFLSANLYARSSFGEEALVNVSIEKESPNAVVTGTIKIRSRSQGMALSLGERIANK